MAVRPHIGYCYVVTKQATCEVLPLCLSYHVFVQPTTFFMSGLPNQEATATLFYPGGPWIF